MKWYEMSILNELSHSQARMRRCSTLCDCIKDINTSAWEHFVKPLPVNTVCLQITAFSFCLLCTQPFWESGLFF